MRRRRHWKVSDGLHSGRSTTNLHQVVDMVEMVTNLLGTDLAHSAADYQIARRPGSDLVRNMARHMKLAVGPSKFQLCTLAQPEPSVS